MKTATKIEKIVTIINLEQPKQIWQTYCKMIYPRYVLTISNNPRKRISASETDERGQWIYK